jgi:hypothetical protein
MLGRHRLDLDRHNLQFLFRKGASSGGEAIQQHLALIPFRSVTDAEKDINARFQRDGDLGQRGQIRLPLIIGVIVEPTLEDTDTARGLSVGEAKVGDLLFEALGEYLHQHRVCGLFPSCHAHSVLTCPHDNERITPWQDMARG